MDDLEDGQGVSLELMAVVPQTLAAAEALSASIERAIQEQTGGGIANLAVLVDESGVFLHGSCSSYYHKQLAQHAAMTVPTGETAATGLTLTNCIEVD
jgi:hypothetical protein